MEIKKILVVFKTHLDIGFTDFAENVTEKYMNEFIPGAVNVARELRELGGEARFKWTTGSWLIYEYFLRKGEKECAELSEAIRNGDICWHGLPCTTHTEIMSKELFEYGLSLSQRLDEKFGVKTINDTSNGEAFHFNPTSVIIATILSQSPIPDIAWATIKIKYRLFFINPLITVSPFSKRHQCRFND